MMDINFFTLNEDARPEKDGNIEKKINHWRQSE